MADATAIFKLLLQDELSPSAKAAAASTAKLKTSLASAKAELSNFQAQLAHTKATGDVGGFAQVKQSQASIFGLRQQLEGMPAELGAGASAAEGMSTALGPIGTVAAAAGAGLLALAAGTVAVTVAMVEMALKVGDANRMLEASFEALGVQGVGSGKKTLALLDEMSSKLPQSRNELGKWTKQIEAMGVTDLSQIRSELMATASAQAIMGDEGAAAYTKIQERVRLAVEAHHGLKLAEKSLRALYQAGVNESEVAAKMGLTTQQLSAKLKAGTVDAEKFGDALRLVVTDKGKGPLDAAMSSLPVLALKAKETLNHLFDGIDTAPLTQAVQELISIGGQGKASGDAMHQGMKGGMNAMISLFADGVHAATRFFLTVELRALQTYIALKPLTRSLESISRLMGALGDATAGGLAKASGSTKGEAKEGLSETAWSFVPGYTTGKALGLGLDLAAALGSSDAQARAHASGVALGHATVAGMKEGTQTHSPSLAAIKIGMGIGEGLGIGMQQSPAPARAARTISGNALGGLAANSNGIGGAAGGGKGGATIGPIHIAITAPDGVTGAHELSMVGLSTALERYQIGSGR